MKSADRAYFSFVLSLKTEPFMAPLLSEPPLCPFGCKGEILDKIYRKNSIRLYGETPRPLDVERIQAAIRNISENRVLNEIETENLHVIAQYFQSD